MVGHPPKSENTRLTPLVLRVLLPRGGNNRLPSGYTAAGLPPSFYKKQNKKGY